MVANQICIVVSESGKLITIEEQRYNLRVSVIAIPAPALLRSDIAGRSVGPRAFGYGVDLVPHLGAPRDTHPVAAYEA